MSNKNNSNIKTNHYNLDEEMSQQDMANMVLSFALASDTRIDNVKNEDLLNPCSEITKELKLATKTHHREIKKIKMLNRLYGSMPAIFETSEVRNELDCVLDEVIDNIKFEKYEIKDILRYLKAVKKAKFYDNMPLLYVTIIGLTRFHNDTSRYYQNKTDMLINELNHIGYIPAKKYELPNEDYKVAIDVAIDKLYGKPVQLFINEENKIKSK